MQQDLTKPQTYFLTMDTITDTNFNFPGQQQLYKGKVREVYTCLLYTSPSPRDQRGSRMPSSA